MKEEDIEVDTGVDESATMQTLEEQKEEQTPESETQPEKSETTEESGAEPEKPRKSGVEKRIGQLTYKVRELERQVVEARKRAAELERKTVDVPAPEGAEPKYEDFTDETQYFKAQSEYAAKKAVSEALKEQGEKALVKEREKATQEVTRAEAEHKTVQQERENEFRQRLEADGSKFEDFKAVAFKEDLAITKEMVEVLKDSDNPADILYQLGKDPEKAAHIAGLSPARMAMELGKLDSPVKPKKKLTNAPDPITPLKPTVATGVFDPEKASYEEYRKWRESQ